MALSDELLATFGRGHGFGCTVAGAGHHCDTFWYDCNPMPLMRAIEAAVRKDDEALIRQLVDALESSSQHTNTQYEWKNESWVTKRSVAISAARARLEQP